jgi:hypothetical protein
MARPFLRQCSTLRGDVQLAGMKRVIGFVFWRALRARGTAACPLKSLSRAGTWHFSSPAPAGEEKWCRVQDSNL